MPKVGMKHVVAAPIDIDREVSGQPLTYLPGLIATRAVSADLTYTRDENEYYADDVLSESDNSATGGDVSIAGSEFLPDARVALFNVRKITNEGDVPIYRTTSVPAPQIGLGYMTTLIYKGKYMYIANWIHKMQFALSGESARTKGATIDWQNETATGKMMAAIIDSSGEPAFKDEVVFEKAGDAIAWLNEKAHITEPAEE